MSYAIIRNEKLTRVESNGAYKHNERKTKNHSNKNIDSSKTDLNYYIKKNEGTYIQEFDRIKQEYDLQGQIRSNSIIMCEMVITSDQAFFDKIGLEESKRYFEESYQFICHYKNLGEQNIISAVVHMDEDSPHLHLLYVPVIHTNDKQGNPIDKLSCRDFWKGKDSYRDLQDKYYAYITSKGFELERGKAVEEIIKDLYQDNVSLHKELSKQAKLVDKAEKYEKERQSILAENKELNSRCQKLENSFDYESYRLENKYHSKINKLEKENNFLRKTIDKLKFAVENFIVWICDKFSVSSEEQVMRDFYKETNISINPNNKQYDIDRIEQKEEEHDLEL